MSTNPHEQNSRLMDLVNLIDDPDESVRESAYKAMLEACRFEIVRAEMAESGTTLPRIVHKLLSETKTVLVDLALRLLDSCLNARRSETALTQCTDESDALKCCSELLAANRPVSTR